MRAQYHLGSELARRALLRYDSTFCGRLVLYHEGQQLFETDTLRDTSIFSYSLELTSDEQFLLCRPHSLLWYDSGKIHQYSFGQESIHTSVVDLQKATTKIDNFVPISILRRGKLLRQLLQDSATRLLDTNLFGKAAVEVRLLARYPKPEDSGWRSLRQSIYLDTDGYIVGEEFYLDIYGGHLRYLNYVKQAHYGFETCGSVFSRLAELKLDTLPVISSGSAAPSRSTDLPKLKPGDMATTFIGHDLNGTLVSSESYRGKTTLLDFWYSGCPPCHQLRPILNRLQERFSSLGLEILGLNPIDSNSSMVAAAARDGRYKSVLVSPSVAQDYSVEGYPTLFLIDATGRIVWTTTGYSPNLEALLIETVAKTISATKQ